MSEGVNTLDLVRRRSGWQRALEGVGLTTEKMSQEIVDIVRRTNAAFNRGDRDGAFADCSADVVWHDLRLQTAAAPHRASYPAVLR